MSSLEYRSTPALLNSLDSGAGGLAPSVPPLSNEQKVRLAIDSGLTHEYQAGVVRRTHEYLRMSPERRLSNAVREYPGVSSSTAEFLYYSVFVLEAQPEKTVSANFFVKKLLAEKGTNIPLYLKKDDPAKFDREFYKVRIQRDGFLDRIGYFGVNTKGTLFGGVFDVDEVGEKATTMSSGYSITLENYSAEMSDLTRRGHTSH